MLNLVFQMLFKGNKVTHLEGHGKITGPNQVLQQSTPFPGEKLNYAMNIEYAASPKRGSSIVIRLYNLHLILTGFNPPVKCQN